jgi:hypothetical protein
MTQMEMLWACFTYNLQQWIRLRKLQVASAASRNRSGEIEVEKLLTQINLRFHFPICHQPSRLF